MQHTRFFALLGALVAALLLSGSALTHAEREPAADISASASASLTCEAVQSGIITLCIAAPAETSVTTTVALCDVPPMSTVPGVPLPATSLTTTDTTSSSGALTWGWLPPVTPTCFDVTLTSVGGVVRQHFTA